MIEPLEDTWAARDLPVLRAVVHGLDTSEHRINLGDVSRATGFDHETVWHALRALESDDDLITWEPSSPPETSRIVKNSGEARRRTGAWPSADNIADKLLAALDDLAEYSDDPVEKSRARKAAEGLGGFSRDTLVALIGASTGVALQ